jgi:hypothetical protein
LVTKCFEDQNAKFAELEKAINALKTVKESVQPGSKLVPVKTIPHELPVVDGSNEFVGSAIFGENAMATCAHNLNASLNVKLGVQDDRFIYYGGAKYPINVRSVDKEWVQCDLPWDKSESPQDLKSVKAGRRKGSVIWIEQYADSMDNHVMAVGNYEGPGLHKVTTHHGASGSAVMCNNTFFAIHLAGGFVNKHQELTEEQIVQFNSGIIPAPVVPASSSEARTIPKQKTYNMPVVESAGGMGGRPKGKKNRKPRGEESVAIKQAKESVSSAIAALAKLRKN